MAYKGKYIPINPKKYVGNSSQVIYRSLWERKLMVYCDRNDNIIEWGSEEVIVPYRSPWDGKMHRYFPDFYMKVKSSDKLNPYVVLGCNSNDDFATIRKKYLQLSKEHHPDVLMNKGVPQEVIEESKKKMRAINSAFDQIEKMKS